MKYRNIIIKNTVGVAYNDGVEPEKSRYSR